jgi:hypothetical protein
MKIIECMLFNIVWFYIDTLDYEILMIKENPYTVDMHF